MNTTDVMIFWNIFRDVFDEHGHAYIEGERDLEFIFIRLLEALSKQKGVKYGSKKNDN